MWMSLLDDLRHNVIDGNADEVENLVRQAIDQGLPPGRILNEGLISAMAEVGQLFERGEFYVPEMLIAARAMESGLELLQPHLAEANVQAIGKVVIGTVQGDLHDIGKNLVGMMLRGAGFEVIDLGVDVSPQKFVEAAKEHQPDFVGCSALLTTTMPKMKAIVEALQTAGVRHNLKVMVGGAPLTEAYAAEIGADIYAPDAASAATRAKQSMRHSERIDRHD
jgi:5-methyltetrahydrofolate--homocysteine methyltransferase